MLGNYLTDFETCWQLWLELRSRSEVVQRWLQTEGVPEPLREELRNLLLAIEQELMDMEVVMPFLLRQRRAS